MKVPSSSRLVALLATMAITVFAVQVFSDNKADVDLWGNLGFVKALPWNSGFLRENTFSFTDPQHSWTNHEWLSEYVLRRTFDLCGNPGLLALKISLGLALILILARAMKRDCESGTIRFLLLLLTISTIAFGFSTRPHLFTYVFLAALLYALKYHPTGKLFWLLIAPAAGLVWTNFHGAFFSGILVLLMFSFLELWRNKTSPARPGPPVQLLTAGIFLALSFINPYGWKLWSFIANSAAKPRPYLTEWAPFNPLTDSVTHIDFVVLALISALCLLFSTRKRNSTWLSLLSISFVAALLLKRNIPIFAITAAFVVPEHAFSVAGRFLNSLQERFSKPLTASVLAVAICASGWYAWNFNKTNPLQIEVPADRFPVDIVAMMKSRGFTGNLLAYFDWAEYCIWHLNPGCRVFLDGRFNDAYRNETIDDYVAFLRMNPGWQKALKAYPVDMVLIRTDLPVCAGMAADKDWTAYCSNNIACLFIRKDKIDSVIPGNRQPPVLQSPKEAYFP